jgi:hypothetical protein
VEAKLSARPRVTRMKDRRFCTFAELMHMVIKKQGAEEAKKSFTMPNKRQ